MNREGEDIAVSEATRGAGGNGHEHSTEVLDLVFHLTKVETHGFAGWAADLR